MKNRLLFCALIAVFIGSLFYACSQEDSNESIDYGESDYDLVGRLHNEALEYVFQELKKGKPLSKSIEKDEITTEKVLKLCERFVNEKGYPVELNVVTKADNSCMDYRKLDFGFSERQNKYLKRLKNILENSHPKEVDVIIEKIKKLEKQLLNDDEISDVQREPLLYGMATCRYSAKYWAENYEKWLVEMKGIDESLKLVKTKTGREETVSLSWWQKYGHIVTADGWWAVEGFKHSSGTGIPVIIIGTMVLEGGAASVISALTYD